MTVKSNTHNSASQSDNPKKNQDAKKKTGLTAKVAHLDSNTSGRPAKAGSAGQAVTQREAQTAQLSPEVVSLPISEKIKATAPRSVALARPVVGRQWNDSRIPSLEDHIRIVQMLHGADRDMKKAAKDLAKRLDVSRKEALEALRACS